jgi:hypothetical protein
LLIEKYGLEKAEHMTRLLLKNYKRLAFINTGQYEIEKYRAYAKKTAKAFGLRFEELEGSPTIVKKMLFGPWDDDFVIVLPGETVSYRDFTNQRSNLES